jgi:hypothetical protein
VRTAIWPFLALLASGCLGVISGSFHGSTGGQTNAGQGAGTTTEGQVIQDGCFAVDPAVLDLGTTLIGTTSLKSVALVNACTAPVTGIMATVGGTDGNLFTVHNPPTTLAAGASAQVYIEYAPLTLETQSPASATFTGAHGEKATLSLLGEPGATARG